MGGPRGTDELHLQQAILKLCNLSAPNLEQVLNCGCCSVGVQMTRETSVSAAICLDLHSARATMIFHRLNENLSIPVDAFNSCSLCTVLGRATLSSVDAFNSYSLCTVLSRTFVKIQKYLVIWHLLY